jgi:fermentation-respiration switch protein FrsA (DUF1100 family)
VKIKYFLYVFLMLLIGCESIVNRMAFFPTVTSSRVSEKIPAGVKEVYITTEDNELLQCFFVANKSSKKLVIYFHGNAGNIYERLPELIGLSKAGANILGVGYRGYGKSSGKPSEKGIYKDGLASLKYVLETLGYPPDKTFICGRSIGTATAVHISAKRKLAGIILITPMTSGRELAKHHGFGPFSIIAGNSFDNIEKCSDILSPILIIHGDKDEVVPWAMGKKIYDTLKITKKMITIEGGYHNDLEFRDPQLFWNSIAEFIQSHADR